MSLWRAGIRCLTTTDYFQANQFMEARSILDSLEIRKYSSAQGQAGVSCNYEGLCFHMLDGRENANNWLEDLSLSRNAFIEKIHSLHQHLYWKILRCIWVWSAFLIYTWLYLNCWNNVHCSTLVQIESGEVCWGCRATTNTKPNESFHSIRSDLFAGGN